MNAPATRVLGVASASARLRDELLAETLAGWTGAVKRLVEPDLPRLLLDLDTPSLFGDAAWHVVRGDDRWLKKHGDALATAAARPATNGVLILVAGAFDGKLAKALAAAGTLRSVPVPGPRDIAPWLTQRLAAGGRAVTQPRAVADELVAAAGEDIDAALALFAVASDYAGDAPVDAAAIQAITGTLAARPVYEFTDAFFAGNARRALELLHAGNGLDEQPALGTLINEARKLIACLESDDDGAVRAWAGARGGGNLAFSRRRARELGRATLMRLVNGLLQTQRQLRTSGHNAELALELLVLHAQRVVRGPGR
jgi:DNA polymerase III delta subunit